MKHLLLIILSLLLLTSPLFGQSSKYESVGQCVLQTMTEKKLTGNQMFEMVKEECERSLGKVGNGVGERNGQGTITYPDGIKYVGEFKGGELWNGIFYEKNGNIIEKWVNGVKQ